MYRCNGIGCSSAWNCDECRQTGPCEKKVVCDVCGKELCEGEMFFDTPWEHLCEECMTEEYGRTI